MHSDFTFLWYIVLVYFFFGHSEGFWSVQKSVTLNGLERSELRTHKHQQPKSKLLGLQRSAHISYTDLLDIRYEFEPDCFVWTMFRRRSNRTGHCRTTRTQHVNAVSVCSWCQTITEWHLQLVEVSIYCMCLSMYKCCIECRDVSIGPENDYTATHREINLRPISPSHR